MRYALGGPQLARGAAPAALGRPCKPSLGPIKFAHIRLDMTPPAGALGYSRREFLPVDASKGVVALSIGNRSCGTATSDPGNRYTGRSMHRRPAALAAAA